MSLPLNELLAPSDVARDIDLAVSKYLTAPPLLPCFMPLGGELGLGVLAMQVRVHNSPDLRALQTQPWVTD